MQGQDAGNSARDWSAWHRAYDDPDSRLSRRLRVVQRHIGRAIDARSGELRLISMCAGQGRDVLGVLALHPRRHDVSALLIELDPDLAGIARSEAERAGLGGVRVVCGDAALTGNYARATPADIVVACGVFGNISMDDIENTIRRLPGLCAPGATVIWTRGWHPSLDVTPQIRGWFAEYGFEEIEFVAPAEDHFSVGSHRLLAAPAPFQPGVRLFQFF